jgi:hypothetical protein
MSSRPDALRDGKGDLDRAAGDLMGIFGPPLENPERLRQVYAKRRRRGYLKKPPLGRRLMLRFPWLGHVEWWHVGLAAALAAGAAIAVRLLVPHADPGGAVLATVDDKPVTRLDVDVEAAAQSIPSGAMNDAMRGRLLEQVINRRLLLAAAKKAGIEDDKGFQASRARMGEVMAAGAMARRFSGGVPRPSDADAQRYVAAHPLQFAARQVIDADAILLDNDAVPHRELMAANTLDDVVGVLRAHSLTFDRAERHLDTAALPSEVAAKLVQAPQGQLFVLPIGLKLMVGAVLRRTPNVSSAADQLLAARSAVARERTDARVDAAVAQLRKNADIRRGPQQH